MYDIHVNITYLDLCFHSFEVVLPVTSVFGCQIHSALSPVEKCKTKMHTICHLYTPGNKNGGW